VLYYLGIDGGGTKTTCAVGDESRLLATATTGPSNIVRVGEMQARESLLQSVRQACAAAGIAPAQVSRTCVGGSGAARPELAEVVRRCLAEIIATPIDVVGDMQIALEAAFDSGPGVIVIAGTGSIAYGRDEQGTAVRAGGWGYAIGDEGSAHWIGRAAVAAVLRAADPRSGDPRSAEPRSESSEISSPPDSSLSAALFKTWGVNSVADFARAANSIPTPDFALLFPAVAASSDPLAAHVLTDAGKELGGIADLVIRRLFAQHTGSVPVAMIGGVFRYAAMVRRIFYDELGRLAPHAEVHPQVVEPVEGALRLARRASHGTDASVRRF
jgi:N-acetylglucosamine kinase-like BadF-type ATPase